MLEKYYRFYYNKNRERLPTALIIQFINKSKVN